MSRSIPSTITYIAVKRAARNMGISPTTLKDRCVKGKLDAFCRLHKGREYWYVNTNDVIYKQAVDTQQRLAEAAVSIDTFVPAPTPSKLFYQIFPWLREVKTV